MDANISNIMKETENNIEKAKQRLNEAYNQYNGHGDSQISSSYGSFAAMRNLSNNAMLSTQSKNLSQLSNDKAHYSQMNNDRYVPLEKSPSIMVVLQDHITAQNQVIEHLNMKIKTIEIQRQEDSAYLNKVQEDMIAINQRLNERGVDVNTERKMTQWRTGIQGDLTSLQSQLTSISNQKNDYVYGSETEKISRDMLDTKRWMNDEFENVSREVENLKYRLAKVERQMISVESDNHDLMKKQIKFNQNLNEYKGPRFENGVHSQPSHFFKDSKDYINSDIKSSLFTLKSQISDIEKKYSDGHIKKKSPKKVKWRTNGNVLSESSRRGSIDFDSPDTIDLSDCDLESSKISISPQLTKDLDDISDDDFELNSEFSLGASIDFL